MRAPQSFDAGDIETLAAILENERLSHCRTRALCFGMFVFCFVVLVTAIGVAVLYLVGWTPPSTLGDMGRTAGVLQALGILSAAVVTFFSMWWAAQSCINSIERSLYAARAGRHQLFAAFLEQLQCTDRKKRAMWLEVVKAALT